MLNSQSHSRMSTKTLDQKIDQLERELQRLKVEVYFRQPHRQRPRLSKYTEPAILRAAQDVREQIWQEKYAKKMARVR